jgi:hypothetical protein
MYIITPSYVVKEFWNCKNLKQFGNILWIFKISEFHIFKSMSAVWVANMFLSSIFFSMKLFYYINPFDSRLQNWLYLM